MVLRVVAALRAFRPAYWQALQTWWGRSLFDYRVGLDLDQHVGIDEAIHFNHRGGRTLCSEELRMGAAVLFPEFDVGDEHASADDIRANTSCLQQRHLDQLQAASGLLIGLTGRICATIFLDSGSSSDKHTASNPKRPTIADFVFPRCVGCDALFHRGRSIGHSVVYGNRLSFEGRSTSGIALRLTLAVTWNAVRQRDTEAAGPRENMPEIDIRNREATTGRE